MYGLVVDMPFVLAMNPLGKLLTCLRPYNSFIHISWAKPKGRKPDVVQWKDTLT